MTISPIDCRYCVIIRPQQPLQVSKIPKGSPLLGKLWGTQMFSPKQEAAFMSLSRKTVIYMLCVAGPAAPKRWRKFTPFCASSSFWEDAELALRKRRMCSVFSEHGSALCTGRSVNGITVCSLTQLYPLHLRLFCRESED